MTTGRDPRLEAFAKLLAVVDRLRAPDGCPWDREQTLSSMVPCLQEEAAEVADAVAEEDSAATAEELGDLLMNILLMARIAQDDRCFDLGTLSEGITEKLVRRHPHVFADSTAETSQEVLLRWESIKREERGAEETAAASAMDGIPAQWSALHRARKQVGRAARTGFVWPDAAQAFAKLEEEFEELRSALDESPQAVERELGDVLFAAVALAHREEIDPELALRRACSTFERRFRAMESLAIQGESELSLATWLDRWKQAKVLSDSSSASHGDDRAATEPEP